MEFDRYEAIKNEVAYFLEDWEIHEYPIDPFEIFEKMEVPVIPYGELSEKERQRAISESEDAYTKFEHNSVPVVYYNEQKPYIRIRFSLIHELGHVVFWHKGCDKAKEEREANFFAGYIVAPIPLVIKNCPDLDIESISN